MVTVVAGSTRDTSARRRNEEALRQADRRKDEFLAMLAHELRNPLAAVANAASLLTSENGEDQSWAAGVIARQIAAAREGENAMAAPHINPPFRADHVGSSGVRFR